MMRCDLLSYLVLVLRRSSCSGIGLVCYRGNCGTTTETLCITNTSHPFLGRLADCG